MKLLSPHFSEHHDSGHLCILLCTDILLCALPPHPPRHLGHLALESPQLSESEGLLSSSAGSVLANCPRNLVAMAMELAGSIL